MRLRALFLSAALLLSFGFPAAAQTRPTLPAPTNLDFEQGQPGEVPPGWFASTPATQGGYTAKIVTEKPKEGRQAVQVAFEGETQGPQTFGNVMTKFDATAFRGKRVRFRAAVRAEVAGQGNQAALWLRVDREGGATGFFDNMGDRPITSAGWKDYEIVGDVAPDAKIVNLGFMLHGAGKAWIDSASFEVLGEMGAGNEPARPLSARGLENLTAFTRLLGYVRYFHPSDQAAAADWEKLALAGVQKAEGAASPEELARVLADFFRPVAPTLRVYPSAAKKPALAAGLSAPAKDKALDILVWEHLGVSVSQQPSIYKSQRVGNQRTAPERGSALGQELDATPYRGKRVTLRAWGRAEVEGTHKAVLALSVYRKDGSKLAEQEAAATSPEWRVVEVAADVPADADVLLVMLGLKAEGRSWWDDVTLEAPGGPAAPLLKNGDFEAASDGDRPSGWEFGGPAQRAGYRAVLSDKTPKSGRRSLAFSWVSPALSNLPKPGEPFVADLGGGVSAMVPLALYKDEKGTLPHAAADLQLAVPEKPAGFTPSGDDRTTRLADVALAWNVFQHFYPYFDVVKTDWPAELRRALSSAATDKDERAFLDTLRRLVAALHDGHGGVYQGGGAAGRLPLTWDWVEDQLVVTRVAPDKAGELRRGDVILTLDGRPAREVLTVTEELTSGSTPQWRRYRGLSQIAQCEKEKQVRLEARHPTGETFTATVPCAANTETVTEERPEKIAEVRPGVFYVDIDRINDDDFKGALDRLAAAKGVIFDLRGYPRNLSTIAIAHITDQTVTSASWNVPLIHRPDREDITWELSNWPVEPAEPRLQGKVAFITGGGAISYAETYMGIVEHYKLASIVGGPTAGTNGNINPFTLPGGYRVIWTGMKVLKHDGSPHHGVGIQPTVPVSRTLRGVVEGRDEVLERAIQIVGGQS